ncbi:MAG: isoprenyl transferase [Candidatus Omnitrophica bacterium]|nr:isoprenyl transferase [Candidatus Omnitrophota bacterium]
MNIPEHIAIIMDGNGRWAGKRHLPRIMGHRRGVESVKNITKACVNLGVKYLTLYAFSTENWNRPRKEIRSLFKLLDNFISTQIRLFNENNVRIYFIGDRKKIDPEIRKKMEKIERDTKDHKKLILNIALSYGSRQEILSAVKALSGEVKNGLISPDDIDEKVFSKHLYTKHCPDPDLLIRTSGEMRVSNFLLWQISYSEIYVTPKLWPDFGEKDLEKAIEEYQHRERRFGK